MFSGGNGDDLTKILALKVFHFYPPFRENVFKRISRSWIRKRTTESNSPGQRAPVEESTGKSKMQNFGKKNTKGGPLVFFSAFGRQIKIELGA